MTLVSSAEETAFDVYRTLVKHGLERTGPSAPTYSFEATGDSKNEFLASRPAFSARRCRRSTSSRPAPSTYQGRHS